MASHEPEKYRFSTVGYVALYSTLLIAYYMFVYAHAMEGFEIDVVCIQMGLLDGPEEPFQAAITRNLQASVHLPSSTLEYCQESHICANCSWVSGFGAQSMMP